MYKFGTVGWGKKTYIQMLERKTQENTAKIEEIRMSGGLDEEMERSLLNSTKVCQCGTTAKPKINSQKAKTHTGYKKRSRCKKCPGCLAEKCMKCNNCLNPSNKQACVLKKCLFPRVPKCPCFD